MLQELYLKSPIPFQHLMVSAYGFLLAWRRFGSLHHSRYTREIRAVEKMDSREIQRYQAARLKQLLVAAGDRPYYAQLFRQLNFRPESVDSLDSLRNLPTLEKRTVIDSPTAFAPERGLTLHTSGTTGSPLSIRCSRDALVRNYAHFYRLREQLGIGKWERCATFAGRTIVEPNRTIPPFWRYNAAANTLLFSTYHMTRSNLAEYRRKLESFKPLFIDAYPSALVLLAREFAAARTKIAPTALLTSSETLTSDQRIEIERSFDCPITDQYGNVEMAGFIAQCRHGRYHVWPSYGVVEILDGDRVVKPGERGELVCTGFINPTMPLVRYRTGDWAIRGDDHCECGLSYPTLESIEGRLDDYIMTPDGRQIGRLSPVVKHLAPAAIRESQIYQPAVDRVIFRYVPGPQFELNAVEDVIVELSKRLGSSISIESSAVERIPRTQNGKFRAVVSDVKAVV